MDTAGNVYVADPGNHRIRKISLGTSLAMKVAEPAFSPNGDGVKDTDQVSVTASGGWNISVDGHPGSINTGPGPDSGNKQFNWDGKVNGIILPDGQYTLRLTAQGASPGPSDPTATVVIDTTPPNSTELQITPNQGDNSVTISAVVNDPVINGVSSGVDKDQIKFFANGVSINKGTPSYDDTSHLFHLVLTHEEIESLAIKYVPNTNNISIQTGDIAGNKSENQKAVLTSVNNIATKIDEGGLGFHLANVNIEKSLFRPLLTETDTVTTTPLHIPSNLFQPKALFVTCIEMPVAFGHVPFICEYYTYPPYIDHSIIWDGKVTGTLKPMPDGVYRVSGKLFGLYEQIVKDITIDNGLKIDYRDQLKDWNSQKHIMWGSHNAKNKPHNWNLFAPIPNTTPLPFSTVADRAAITAVYNSYVLPVIISTLTLDHVTSEVRGQPMAGLPSALVTYNNTITANDGKPHVVTVQTRRYFSSADNKIIEVVGDAFVN